MTKDIANPRTQIFPNKGDLVSLYSVWIYPFDLAKRGARIAFFKAEVENAYLCYLYLPEDLSDEFKGEAYTQGIDQICEIGKRALQDFGIDFGDQTFDIHVDVGTLDIADLED